MADRIGRSRIERYAADGAGEYFRAAFRAGRGNADLPAALYMSGGGKSTRFGRAADGTSHRRNARFGTGGSYGRYRGAITMTERITFFFIHFAADRTSLVSVIAFRAGTCVYYHRFAPGVADVVDSGSLHTDVVGVGTVSVLITVGSAGDGDFDFPVARGAAFEGYRIFKLTQ